MGNHTNEVEISTIHHFLYKHILKPYIWILKDNVPNLLDLTNVNISFPSFSVLPETKTKQLLRWNHQYTAKEIISEIKKVYWFLDEYDNLLPKYKGELPIGRDYILEYKNNLWNDKKITPDDILKFSYEILIKKPEPSLINSS